MRPECTIDSDNVCLIRYSRNKSFRTKLRAHRTGSGEEEKGFRFTYFAVVRIVQEKR